MKGQEKMKDRGSRRDFIKKGALATAGILGLSEIEASKAAAAAKKVPPFKFKRQVDMRKQPVKRLIALGESTTWGYCVSSKDKCWVNQSVQMLEDFQGSKIELINQAIGSNVLTLKCPAYDAPASGWEPVGASALERVDADLIAHNPDMIYLSYGLNDSRGGTPPETFRQEYQKLIDQIRAKIDPTIVIVNTYYMHEHAYSKQNWDHSNYELTEVYNRVIKELAEKNKRQHNCKIRAIHFLPPD